MTPDVATIVALAPYAWEPPVPPSSRTLEELAREVELATARTVVPVHGLRSVWTAPTLDGAAIRAGLCLERSEPELVVAALELHPDHQPERTAR